MAAQKRVFQSRIPPDFLPRTLRRLLPSSTQLEKLSRERLIELATLKKKLAHLILTDPSRFYKPNPGGQREFQTWWDHDSAKRILLFLAGNKTGKTTGGALLMGERLWGKPLWGRESRTLAYQTPATGIVFTEDFESHRDTILPTIQSWWPKSIIRRVVRNAQNCPTELILENDSVLKFKTYAQGSETAEGKDWNQVWFDEPPPHSVYTAAFRGIVSTGGRMYVTATLLKEAWLFDEQEKDYAQFFAAEIHDNEWISQEAKTAFLDSLSDEEREVRESGKPFSLTGLIYKYFADRDPYVIPPFELPERWPYFIGVDPHERRPVHVLFCTLNPHSEIIVLDYLLARGDTDTIIQKCRDKEKELGIPSPIRLCIMDPNRGAAKQINQISWEQVFSEAGYDVVLGQDDLNIGHSAMYTAFRLDNKTGRPGLSFTTQCRGRYGPIWQFQRYAWDDWANHTTRDQKDIKEKPRQLNKDFPDICRYIVMENLQFDSLVHGHRIIQTSKEIKPYGKVQRLGREDKYNPDPYSKLIRSPYPFSMGGGRLN